MVQSTTLGGQHIASSTYRHLVETRHPEQHERHATSLHDVTTTHGVTAEQPFPANVLEMKSEGVQCSSIGAANAHRRPGQGAPESLKVINVENAAYAADLPQLTVGAARACSSPTVSLYQHENANDALGRHVSTVGEEGQHQHVLEHRAHLHALRLDGRAALRAGASRPQVKTPLVQPRSGTRRRHQFLGQQPHRCRQPRQEHPAELLAPRAAQRRQDPADQPLPHLGLRLQPRREPPASGWKPQTR